ncbi:hypothetical protein M8009_02415 [Halomonas sp. ATCH28]|uniref:Major capsid protein n=1 Tax=Halomonas gemina TaxID=2945105 RepID=A0ABT0SWY6_9GAMM|nr:hypothetical protein [Halomonas gemina]MCL7939160.1 hypothetical protein [Halomonas gemina]
MSQASIQAILTRASRALPANVTLKNPGTPNETYQTLPGASGVAAARGALALTDTVPRLPETTTRAINQPAGESESLAMAIVRRSRVAQAGARVIPVELAPEPGSPTALWKRAGGFTVISGASFTEGDDASPLAAQELPAMTEEIDLDFMGQYGVRFELSRKDQKHSHPGELDAKIVNGIVYGIATLIDRVALETLEAKLLEAGGGAAMPTFSMADVAAKGLRFNELRAIVGTDATGHLVEDGQLRVRGFPAEFTGEHPATFAGAFDRLGVAVMDDIRVLVERTRLDGGLAVTCWVDAMALVPDAGYFWHVSS